MHDLAHVTALPREQVLGLVPFVDLVNHGFGTVNNNKMVMRMPARLRSYTVAAPTRLRPDTEKSKKRALD